jgi:hypothetical protein
LVEDEDGDGDAVAERVGVGEFVTVPVHAVPFRVNDDGAGLLLLFHEPLKPNDAVPFVATEGSTRGGAARANRR